MALAPSGYSGTPLAQKLGLKDGMAVAFVALPGELGALAGSAAFGSVTKLADWKALEAEAGRSGDMAGTAGRFDLIHAFTRSRAEIEDYLPALQHAIRPDGTIWVSWPKKASKVSTDVTEDVVRDLALALDLVDVKVAAVDAVWSGLKLVIRKERRAAHAA